MLVLLEPPPVSFGLRQSPFGFEFFPSALGAAAHKCRYKAISLRCTDALAVDSDESKQIVHWPNSAHFYTARMARQIAAHLCNKTLFLRQRRDAYVLLPTNFKQRVSAFR